MRGLENKVVIVTGAGQGIGRATARRFASEGARVVVAEFNEMSGAAVAEELLGEGFEACFVKVDVSQSESVKTMIKTVVDKFGRIDVLVNNAGIVQDSTLKKMTEAQFDQVIAVNLKGPFLCGQEVAAVMREQGAGVILNAASVVALYGNFGQSNYVASKSGVIGMTRVWARELGRYGVRVNAIAPGFIKTAMTEGIPEPVMDKLTAKIPMGALGEADDIAAAYCFLASDDARYITGTVLSVDGGMVV